MNEYDHWSDIDRERRERDKWEDAARKAIAQRDEARADLEARSAVAAALMRQVLAAEAQQDRYEAALVGLLDLFTFSYEDQNLTRTSRDRRTKAAIQRAREALAGTEENYAD